MKKRENRGMQREREREKRVGRQERRKHTYTYLCPGHMKDPSS